MKPAGQVGGAAVIRSLGADAVHVTSVHSAGDTRILVKECRSLAAAGYRVVLVATGPPPPKESVVVVRTVPAPRGRLLRMTLGAWRVYRAALKERGRIYHVHDPELLPWAGLIRLRGGKVIYDAHEDLPSQIADKVWIPRPVRGAAAFAAKVIQSVLARFLTAIVAATPPVAARFPSGRTTVIQNFPLHGELTTTTSRRYQDRPPHVAYVGAITPSRGAKEMVDAFSHLSGPHEHARLILAGSVAPPDLEIELRSRRGWERVEMKGWLSRSEVGEVMGSSRVGLILLQPLPRYVESYPTKLFEYMSVGLPVVASDFPLWREIVAGARCGLLVDPMNPVEIARAIARLLDNPEEAEAMGARGAAAISRTYNWDSESRKLISLYQQILGPPRSVCRRFADCPIDDIA